MRRTIGQADIADLPCHKCLVGDRKIGHWTTHGHVRGMPELLPSHGIECVKGTLIGVGWQLVIRAKIDRVLQNRGSHEELKWVVLRASDALLPEHLATFQIHRSDRSTIHIRCIQHVLLQSKASNLRIGPKELPGPGIKRIEQVSILLLLLCACEIVDPLRKHRYAHLAAYQFKSAIEGV